MVRLAVAQVNPTVGAFQSNFAKLKAAIREATRAKANVVVFPEMVTTGYPPNDLLEREEFWEENEAMLQALAPLSAKIAILLGSIFPFPKGERPPGGIPLAHGALFFKNGKRTMQAKTHLPNVDVFNETRYFSSAQSHALMAIAPRVKAALAICEDIWNVPQSDRPYGPYTLYAGDSLQRLAAKHPSLFIAINASPYWRGKFAARLARAQEIVARYQRPFLYVNAVGANDELIFDGRSFALNARGDCVWQMPGFKEDVALLEWQTLVARTVVPVTESIASPYADLAHAIALGIRDYVHKSGFEKVVLGLSGGIDSALVAALAVQALGKDAVLALWMPSPYSSEESAQDAHAVAEKLGIECRTLAITSLMEASHRALAPWKQRTPAWQVADENVQARLRGLLLMGVANGERRLLLSTSNKSELAVGYSTLYGDMCGALAPIGDLYKTEIYALARDLNPQRIFSERLLAKAPSAELRPNQKDEDSLPPYAILDRLIQAYMEARLSPDDLVDRGFDPAMVAWFIRAFHGHEYKRKQAAPILKLCPRSFGIGWRYPLVKRVS